MTGVTNKGSGLWCVAVDPSVDVTKTTAAVTAVFPGSGEPGAFLIEPTSVPAANQCSGNQIEVFTQSSNGTAPPTSASTVNFSIVIP